MVPDGIHQGEPYILTNEMLAFLLKFFRVHPTARPIDNSPSSAFFYRGAQLMRPQKWGKSPFSASTCLAYAFGPIVFDGWDANGEPVGRPHPTPHIQIVSTSEAQTDNTWLALFEMASRGPIAEFGVDIGMMDINLPGGGKIEPRTSSGHARLGARITYGVFDEPHLMIQSNGGLLLATTMKRNLSGMGGRWLETTNAYDPNENSVAQRTQESVLNGTKDILIDYRPPPHRPDLADEEDSLEMLRYCYGDSYWVDPARIYADARDPSVCPTMTDAMRYFFNLPEVGVDEAVDPTLWDAKAIIGPLQPREKIALGFKGGAEAVGGNEPNRAAWTSLVASRISDGRWFHLKTWNPADFIDDPEGFVHMRYLVNLTVMSAFKAYDVRFMVGDPNGWRAELDNWTGLYPKRVVELNTGTESRLDQVVQRFLAAFAGDMTHDGNEILGAHAKSAAWARGAKRKARPEEGTLITQHYLKVVKKWDNRPIDAFVAGMLAEAARGLALEHGDGRPPVKPLVAWI